MESEALSPKSHQAMQPKRFVTGFAIRSLVISVMLGDNLRKTPDFAKRIVQGSRGNADHVRFAEVAFHAGRLECAEQVFRMFLDYDRQLATTCVHLTRRDDRKAMIAVI